MTDSVIRAFELPLQHCDKETWPLFRECWRHSTDLANWAARYLAAHDPGRKPGDKKLRPYKMPYLYGLAPKQFAGWKFFAGAMQTAGSIIRKVEKKYKQERFEAVWMGRRRTPEFSYPFPWPVHNQSWRDAWIDDSGKPCVSVALPGGAVDLRLRGGPEFGRQMAQFRETVKQFAAWKATPTNDRPKRPWAELVIREQSCSSGCHRPTIVEKTAGGGQDRHQRVMVKMVASLPVQQRTGDRVLTLTTDPNAFWVVELDGRQAWVLNADHVKRAYQWIAKHEDTLQRLAQDSKAERRLRSEDLLRLNEFREKRCEKHRKRMSSWLHETAAQLVGFAQRQHVGHILYRDVEQGFIERFPWAALKSKLKDKCDLAGVRLDCASDGEGGTNVA